MSGAIGGSKDGSPKNDKDEEEKHKQRERTAYASSPYSWNEPNMQAEISSPVKSPASL
jgi:hypothetical protein